MVKLPNAPKKSAKRRVDSPAGSFSDIKAPKKLTRPTKLEPHVVTWNQSHPFQANSLPVSRKTKRAYVMPPRIREILERTRRAIAEIDALIGAGPRERPAAPPRRKRA